MNQFVTRFRDENYTNIFKLELSSPVVHINIGGHLSKIMVASLPLSRLNVCNGERLHHYRYRNIKN